MTQLHMLSLIEVRDLLSKGEVTPLEVATSAFARIRETEPMLNACITVCEESVLQEAKKLEIKGPDGRPLWGVPLALKDLFCTKGTRTTCASHMLENFVPPYDATVVERLKDAGALIAAKNNMDEFAMGSSTEFSFFGSTHNPWDTTRVPGGSSGGSAASVAAGQVYGALGSDSGGSIRQPAALCGCVGIKPTYGRVSRYGAVAYASSFDQAGTLSRTVADSALLLSVIGGYDSKDATSAPVKMPCFHDALAKKDLKGITLGLPKEYWQQELSAEVTTACENALQEAKKLGAIVKEVSLPSLAYSVAAYHILSSAEASTNMARFDGVRYGLRKTADDDLIGMYTASRSAGFGEEVKRRILLGTHVLSSGYYDAYYKKASQIRRIILTDYEKALSECDALLTPCTPVTAWKIGEHSHPLTAYKMDILTLGLNLAGLPGLSLPVGNGKDSGLPVGLQVIGKAFDEKGILEIAAALERALPSCCMPQL